MEMSFFGEPPEHIKQQINEMRDQHMMSREVAANEVKDFLANAPVEHLRVMRNVLMEVANSEDPMPAAYYQGLIASAMLARFDVCLGCGVDHTADELLDNDSEESE